MTLRLLVSYSRAVCVPLPCLIFMLMKRTVDTLLLKPRRTSATNDAEKPDPFGVPLEPRISIE
jgi:hypothetical protein